MKKLLPLLLFPFIICGQPEHTGELRIGLINYSSYWDVLIKLTAVGARWDENFKLTEDYEIASVYLTSGHENSQTIANFDHILDPNAGENPIFAVGLYKISAIENGIEQALFYCDWRTSDWRTSLDIYFKYDVGNKRFKDWGNTQTINYSYQSLWNLTGNLLKTVGLEDYWANALVMTNNGSNKPQIIWGPYEDDDYTTSGYYVYTASNYSVTPPPLNQFSLVATLNSTTHIWTDNSYVIGGVLKAHYYVKAIITPVESGASTTSSPTNIVTSTVSSTGGGVGHKDNINSPEVITFYSLNQNYPNPFNPSTIINYQTPVDNFVTLKVFDVLGREVADLVNTYKEAGIHSVEFIASELPSGIYFYKIQIGNYVETRKLILQK